MTAISYINMGTKELVAGVEAADDKAKQELMRRAARGSRFAVRACKKLGIEVAAKESDDGKTYAMVKAKPRKSSGKASTAPVSEASSDDEILAALAGIAK